MPTAATTSARPSSRSTSTASSSGCGQHHRQHGRPTCPPSVPTSPPTSTGLLLAGVYTTPAIHCEVKVRLHQHVPVDAIAAPGGPRRPSSWSGWSMSRRCEMGIDRAEIRRRNMIPRTPIPYQTPVMVQYDSGDPRLPRQGARGCADWAGFAARKSESARAASSAASGCAPMSRRAASRPRASPAGSARAAASSRAPRCACTRPATSRC